MCAPPKPKPKVVRKIIGSIIEGDDKYPFQYGQQKEEKIF